MPEREVRYCTTEDGVRIAYTVEGEGPPLLALQWFVESFQLLQLLLPEWEDWFQRLGEGSTLVRYEARGTGLSQRDVTDLSMDALLRDMDAVVAAAGLSQFSLYGGSASSFRAIEYAARNPDKVTELVLIGGQTKITDAVAEAALQAFIILAESDWPLAAQTLTDLRGRADLADENRQIATVYARSSTGDIVARMLKAHKGIDVTDRLQSVKAKSLVVDILDPGWATQEVSRAIATRIPNARLVSVSGGSGAFMQQSTIDVVTRFLGRTTGSAVQGATTRFRTILFTDLVGHTQMMSRLGDEAGRAVLREHEDITRKVLKGHDGTEVKTLGDGFMASFASVTKAVECAIALQRAFKDREGEPLSVRVGLNAGEPIEEDGDLFGATVILASRIAARAEGGEILVSDNVRSLCSGKNFLFADRGEFAAKGIEEPVRVYEVSWQTA